MLHYQHNFSPLSLGQCAEILVYLSGKVPALGLVLERLPSTLLLAAATMAISIPLAILLGALAVLNPGSWADKSVTVASLSGVSVVDFWLGLMLILIFSVQRVAAYVWLWGLGTFDLACSGFSR